MSDPFNLDIRLTALESAAYKETHQPKVVTQAELKSLHDQVNEIDAKLRLAESRAAKTSDLTRFATKADLIQMSKTITQVVGKGSLAAEQNLEQRIDKRIRATLAEVHDSVMASKSIASSTAIENANLLLARAAYLAK